MENSKLSKGTKITLSILLIIIGALLVISTIVFQKQLPEFLIYFINILGAIILFIGISFIYSTLKSNSTRLSIKQMSLIAIQSAISVILY